MWKRLATDAIWVIVFFVIALLVSLLVGFPTPQSIIATVLAPLAGLVLRERRWIWRWRVNIVRAARILIKQEQTPKEFVVPYIEWVDLFPDRVKGIDEVPYIKLILSWRNYMFRDVRIEDIRGSIRVEGSYPPDDLPSNIATVTLEPLKESMNPSVIPTNLTGDALRIIKRIRQAEKGKAVIQLCLSARVNGVSVDYDISYDAYYVG